MKSQFFGALELKNLLENKKYNWVLLGFIFLSILLLTIIREDQENGWVKDIHLLLEVLCLLFFSFDIWVRYGAYKMKYLQSSWFVIDVLSVVPAFFYLILAATVGNTDGGGEIGVVLKTLRFFRIIRILKLSKTSNDFTLIIDVIYKERRVLSSVFTIVSAYILVVALIVLHIEEKRLKEYDNIQITQNGDFTSNETSDKYYSNHIVNYMDAICWATSTLTSVQYKEVQIHGLLGQLISILSSVLGLGVIALPSGIITARYLSMLKLNKSKAVIAKKISELGEVNCVVYKVQSDNFLKASQQSELHASKVANGHTCPITCTLTAKINFSEFDEDNITKSEDNTLMFTLPRLQIHLQKIKIEDNSLDEISKRDLEDFKQIISKKCRADIPEVDIVNLAKKFAGIAIHQALDDNDGDLLKFNAAFKKRIQPKFIDSECVFV